MPELASNSWCQIRFGRVKEVAVVLSFIYAVVIIVVLVVVVLAWIATQ
jgi:hypothetical protein